LGLKALLFVYVNSVDLLGKMQPDEVSRGAGLQLNFSASISSAIGKQYLGALCRINCVTRAIFWNLISGSYIEHKNLGFSSEQNADMYLHEYD
jgi:hypothetical protein